MRKDEKIQEEIERMMAVLIDGAKENIIEDGVLRPLVVTFGDELKMSITILDQFERDNKHDVMTNLGIELYKKIPNIEYFAFIGDSYCSENKIIPPSADPDRKECIVCCIVGLNGNDKVDVYPYERIKGKIVFDDNKVKSAEWGKNNKKTETSSPILDTLIRSYKMTKLFKGKNIKK